MRSNFLSAFLLFLLLLTNRATAQSCCSSDASWVAMVSSKDFQEAHLAPLPLNYTPAGEAGMINFATDDSVNGHAFYVPSDKPTDKVLLVFHEWWGLNDYVRREAERWQEMLGNVDVYAVDLYDGRVATTAEEAGKLSKGMSAERGRRSIEGLLRHIGKKKEVATLGWCFGGCWSFTASLIAGPQAVGAVMYYGFPEQDTARINKLTVDVLYLWAEHDNHITHEVVDEFQRKVIATGNKFTWHSFDAAHAFANPSNPKYDPVAAEKAQVIAHEFLREKLKLE